MGVERQTALGGCDARLEVARKPISHRDRQVDLAPGAYPAFSLLTAYGQAAPLNLGLQRAGRVLPFPFHFLDSTHAMNVRPLNYTWPEFYDHVVDLTRYALSGARVHRRFWSNRGIGTRFFNAMRAINLNRVKYQAKMRRLLDKDLSIRGFMEGESVELPWFYQRRVRASLGPLWDALPDGALMHDQNAYLKSQGEMPAKPGTGRRQRAVAE